MKTIFPDLKQYVETAILPVYRNFDAAHQTAHAQTVIEESLQLAGHYNVDINMVYVIAAYHDTGLRVSRERHHLESGAIVMADKNLRKWFNETQIRIIKEAVEDHRASLSDEPRSIYGKIVSEADRDIRPMQIIKRTVQYSLDHYPGKDTDFYYRRSLSHLKEKYGEGGYLKLWIPESKNARQLQELRTVLHDEKRLKSLIFEQIHTIFPK